MRRARGLTTAAVAAALLLATLGTAAAAKGTTDARATSSGQWTTYGYDNARSDDDASQPAIHSVSAHPSWDDSSLDGAVYGQPLVYDGVVYVATEGDSVYAVAATTGHVLWRVHVGNPAPLSIVDTAPTLSSGCGDVDPLGITGTPVIDVATDELFAAEETLAGGSVWQDVRHWLVAISLKSHRELWHRSIDPPHANEPNDYYIAAEQQRPALTLLGSRVYVEYGGLSGDCGTYHGYVVSVPTARTGGLSSYQVPTQREGGIWGVGGAAVSPQGDLYVATGNGSSNTLSDFDEGNSLVELSPSLRRLGYYAPSNWVELNDDDWDLGSAGPIVVPGSKLLFVAGKPANEDTEGFLVHDGKLGGVGHGAFAGRACGSGGVYGADAVDTVGTRVFVYTACQNGVEALAVHAASPISFHEAWTPSTGSPNGPPVVAGGLVFSLDWYNNLLYAMNPVTGHVVLVRDTDGLDHFATPSLGDGELFVPTGSGVEAFRLG